MSDPEVSGVALYCGVCKANPADLALISGPDLRVAGTSVAGMCNDCREAIRHLTQTFGGDTTAWKCVPAEAIPESYLRYILDRHEADSVVATAEAIIRGEAQP